MPGTPEPQASWNVRRRHPASRARVAAALLSVGGFLGAAGGMVFANSSGTAASASTSTRAVTTTHGS